MDLHQVEVLDAQPGPLQQPRHRVRGGHEQAVLAVHVVHRAGLVQGEVRQRFEAARLRPLLARQQDRRRAVRQRGRIARRHRRVRAVRAEHRFQRGEFLDRRAGAQVLVAAQAPVRDHQVVQEAPFVRGGQALVARGGQQVLVLTGDRPAAGGDGGVVAHRQAGAGFGVARDVRDEVAGAYGGKGLEAGSGGLRAAGGEQDAAQFVVDAERGVARGVGAARDRRVDGAEGDGVRGGDDRLETGAARLLYVVRRGTRIEGGAEDGLARQVEIAAVLEDRARDERPDPVAGQSVPLHQAVQRGRQQVLVGGGRVRAVGPGERDAAAAEHRDAAHPRHGERNERARHRDHLVSVGPGLFISTIS